MMCKLYDDVDGHVMILWMIWWCERDIGDIFGSIW